MVYILVLLGALSLYCLLKSYINKYSWYFSAIIWSLIAAMYASFLLISASGNYTSIGYIFDDFDGRMFLSLIANKMNFFTIIRIFNVSSAVFLTSLSLFSKSYFTEKGKESPVKEVIKNASHFVFPALYCVFYDPLFVYNMYCSIMEGNDTFYLAACIADLLFYIITGMYMIFPLFFLFKKKKQLATEYKQKQLFGIALYIVLSDIIYLIILRLFSLRRLYFMQTPQQVVAIRTYGAQFQREYLIYPIITLIAIIVLIITIGKFHLIRQDGVIRRLIFEMQSKKTQRMMTGILHSVKGVIYSYKLSLDDVIDSIDSSEQKNTLIDLSSNMDTYIENLASMLNSKEVRGDFAVEECYLSDIIEDALSELLRDGNIKITRDYTPHKEKVYADPYYLKCAISNILSNAADAIAQKNEPGEIRISASSEFDLAVLSVSDTGTGISKRELKYIFNQFYTTKSRVKNWGVGLSFTYKIIKKHRGHISVKSKVGKGTTFDIILPRI